MTKEMLYSIANYIWKILNLYSLGENELPVPDKILLNRHRCNNNDLYGIDKLLFLDDDEINEKYIFGLFSSFNEVSHKLIIYVTKEFLLVNSRENIISIFIPKSVLETLDLSNSIVSLLNIFNHFSFYELDCSETLKKFDKIIYSNTDESINHISSMIIAFSFVKYMYQVKLLLLDEIDVPNTSILYFIEEYLDSHTELSSLEFIDKFIHEDDELWRYIVSKINQ